MIVNFKNKEELKNEEIEKQIEFANRNIKFKKDRDRYIRIVTGNMQPDDRLYFSNEIIRFKFMLRDYYKRLEEGRKLNEFYKTYLDRCEDEEVKKYLDENIKYMNSINGCILSIGNVIEIILDKMNEYFTENEMIQLISGSHEQCKRIKEYYDKKETGTKSFSQSLIIHHGEYRWRKGRAKDFIDCPKWEMPLFFSLNSYMWSVIDSDQKAKAEIDNLFADMFEDTMINVITDLDGNVVSAEKIIQEYTSNDLIRNFSGLFVSDLKRKNTLDHTTIYTIRRLDGGVYSVLDENKNSIATIYKK